MKDLKVFESFGDYYFEITSADYNHPKGDIESMSENDFFSIRDKMRNKRWSVYSYKDTMLRNTENIKDVCEIIFDKEDVKYYRKLILTKMSDEWYYIFLRENPWGGNDVKNTYYKADQIEGLEKFIDEVL